MRICMRNRVGAALVFVLGLIAASAAIAVYLVQYAAFAVSVRASARAESRLRVDAISVLNATIAAIEEYRALDGGLYSASQGWGAPLKGRGLSLASAAAVRVSDESGKIPMSSLTAERLQKMFEEVFRLGTRASQELVDCITDWQDEDDSTSLYGAEKADYSRGEALPPNRPLRSFSELRRIRAARDAFFDAEGNPNELYRAFTRMVSLEKFSKVNLNSATPEVIDALMLMEGRETDKTLYPAIRGLTGNPENGITWVKSTAEILNRGAREVPSEGVGCSAGMLKIEVAVVRGAARYTLVAYYGAESEKEDRAERAKRVLSTKSGSKSSGSQSSGSSFKILKISETGIQ